jgi:hypothetical protein
VLGVLLLSGVAWLLGMRPVGPQSTATVASMPTTTHPVAAAKPMASPFDVFHSQDLASALARFSAQAPAREVRRLRAEVDTSCRSLALLENDRRSEVDARREPALRELRRRCATLPVPSMYVPVADTRLPSDDTPDPVAASRALADLHRATGPDLLIDAWMEAYRHDALPQQDIFHDQRRMLPAEAETLIRVVVDWRECARLRACGPDSLFALRVCALNGCAAGSDVQSAWHQALSPRDYESALAIHRWLAQEHVGADR